MVIVACTLSASCATHIRKPEGPPPPPSVKFTQFDSAILKHVEIAPQLADSGANQKAVKKIDEHLQTKMKYVFPDVQEPGTSAPAKGRTLTISPYVSDIKFIGGGARFWAGAMAGSSAVLMKVTYTDSDGHVIADPEFYADANAFAGAFSIGATDNLMLDRIADDIVNYTKLNH